MSKREDDLERELRDHLELEAEEQRGAGASAEESRLAARRVFGNLAHTKENVRAAWGWTLLEQFAADVRYGVRTMRRSPGLTAVAVLSLALGIGANTAIFSVADAVLFRTLPVAKPEQLDLLTIEAHGSTFTLMDSEEYRALQQPMRPISAMIARFAMSFSVAAGAEASRAVVEFVSGNYFTALGVGPLAGRVLTDDDDRTPLANPVAVIGYRCWRQRLGGDPAAIGKTIRINGNPYTIVGIAPPAFYGVEVGSAPEVWIPASMMGQYFPAGEMPLNVMERRAPGVSRDQAQAALNLAYRQMLEADPERDPVVCKLAPGGRGYSLVRQRFENPLLLLLSLAALVLLVACSNVAGLLLARSASRRREIGVRLAVGASRGRLIRQLLTESALLSAAGGALGVAAAAWGAGFLTGFLPADELTLVLNAPTDVRVLAFALAISTLSSLLLGLTPAIRSTKADLSTLLRSEASPAQSGRRRAGSLLVPVQVALSLLLVAGAGLFMQSLRNAAAVDLGLDAEHALMATIVPGGIGGIGYSAAQSTVFCRELEARLQAVPGVRSVGYASGYKLPLRLDNVFTQSGSKSNSHVSGFTLSFAVGGDFFTAMGNQIVRGRAFTPEDAANPIKVMVVNKALAKLIFPGGEAVGQLYKPAPEVARRWRLAAEYQVIGVAQDLRGIYEPAAPTAYTDGDQDRTPPPFNYRTYYLRTAGDPAPYVAMLRQILRGLDRNMPVSGLKTLAQEKADSLAQERLLATLSGFFGVLALLLAAIGIYGIVAYGVARRTHEIGIRMSLGASRTAVVWMVVRGSLAMVACGIAIGLPLCFWMSKLAASLLFGVRPNDPATIAATIGVLAAVAVLAAWLPARRASRVNPVIALRWE